MKIAGKKPEFYIAIDEETPKNPKKRPTSLSAEMPPTYKPKANPPPIYKDKNLKDYNDYIEECNVYFKDQGNMFFTKTAKIAHTVTFTIFISRSRWIKTKTEDRPTT